MYSSSSSILCVSSHLSHIFAGVVRGSRIWRVTAVCEFNSRLRVDVRMACKDDMSLWNGAGQQPQHTMDAFLNGGQMEEWNFNDVPGDW